MGHQRKRRSAQQWQSLLEKHQNSGLSAPKFCQSQGIGYQSFMKWHKRLKSPVLLTESPKNAFIELTPPAGTEENEPANLPDTPVLAPMPLCVELFLGGGIELRITRRP